MSTQRPTRFNLLLLCALAVILTNCGPAQPPSTPAAQPAPATSPLPTAQSPEEAYRAYWAAWVDATSLQDMYPYYGGPEFEEMKQDIEADPSMASMGFMMYKGLRTQGSIGSLEVISQSDDAAEIKVIYAPNVAVDSPGVTSSTELTASMVKIDGRWLVGSEGSHSRTSVSGEFEWSGEDVVEEATPSTEPTVRFGDLDRAQVGEGSAFQTFSKKNDVTEAIVAYYRGRQTLTVNLYAEKSLYNFAVKNFTGEPGIYYEMPKLYVIHSFSEVVGIRCDIRELEYGERPPEGIDPGEAAALGKFKAYFTCPTVHLLN